LEDSVETSTVFYLVLLFAALAADHAVIWRRFTVLSKSTPEQARRTLWQSWIGMLWLLAIAAALIWAQSGRPWSLLRLEIPTGWRLWASAALVLAVAALYLPTISRLRRVSAERKASLYSRLESHAGMLPHTKSDLTWFIALSVTAGICEELVFRGYLLWAAQSLLGFWPAVAVSCLVFAFAHAYQGVGGIVKTGLIGAIFMVVVLGLGSLVPAMVAHALVDVGQGIVAWLVLRPSGPPQGGSERDDGSAAPVGSRA
jgi:membrane protease YdiL (CAAX protease family)